ncbi:MAG: 50S ribosomal protein L29 [Bacteroidota bacterium]
MENSGLRTLSIEELKNKLDREKENYQRLKFAHSMASIDNPMKIRENRRLIARISTEIRAQELGQVAERTLENLEDKRNHLKNEKRKSPKRSNSRKLYNLIKKTDEHISSSQTMQKRDLQKTIDMYKVSPSKIAERLSGDELTQAINSFYEVGKGRVKYWFSISAEDLKNNQPAEFFVGNDYKFHIDFEIDPSKEVDKSLLENFQVLCHSDHLELKDDYLKLIELKQNKGICTFMFQPKSEGKRTAHFSFLRNAQPIEEHTYKIPVVS